MSSSSGLFSNGLQLACWYLRRTIPFYYGTKLENCERRLETTGGMRPWRR